MRFCRRHHRLLDPSLPAATAAATTGGGGGLFLPPRLEARAAAFRRALGGLGGFFLSRVGSMDELPLHFGGHGGGRESIGRSMRAAGLAGAAAAVILSARADGLLLKPMVIIKVRKK